MRPQDGAALKMAPEDAGADGAGIPAFNTAQALTGGMGALRSAQLALLSGKRMTPRMRIGCSPHLGQPRVKESQGEILGHAQFAFKFASNLGHGHSLFLGLHVFLFSTSLINCFSLGSLLLHLGFVLRAALKL